MGFFCYPKDCLKKSQGPQSGEDELRRETWRWRFNWFFTSAIASLYAISNTSLSSSFHQFVTNPRNSIENGTLNNNNEFGLGQTESFYSWLLAMYYMGSFVGAILSGFLARCFPYSYLFFTSLMAHTVGYILYAISYEGWIIMISKFLSGYFLGAQVALSFSYVSETSVEYVQLQIKWKKKVKKDSIPRIRNFLFATQTIGKSFGYVLGPVAATIFAQFPIDPFRSIAWYNVACGVGFMIMQLLLFRGESSFKKLAKRRKKTKHLGKKKSFKFGYLTIFLLSSIALFRIAMSFRFGVYETLLNPILSDSFGLDETYASYYFLAVSSTQVLGVMILFTLQLIRTSSQLTAIIGISVAVAGGLLIADWQAIPYDPCTEYSPFHHPEITQNYSLQLKDSSNRSSLSIMTNIQALPVGSVTDFELLTNNPELKSTLMTAFAHYRVPEDVKLECHSANEYRCSSGINLHITFRENQQPSLVVSSTISNSAYSESYLCSVNSWSASNLSTVCAHWYRINKDAQQGIVRTQVLMQLSHSVYNISRTHCINANITGHHCKWTPTSTISNEECPDCQPICRSEEQTLNFVQFLIGSILLMMAFPILWVPVTAMTSDQVPVQFQTIAMGILAALSSLGRSLSPVFLDASYEAVKKRTFFPMLILVGSHIWFLIEILIFYRQLGPKTLAEAQNDQEDNGDEFDLSDMDTLSTEDASTKQLLPPKSD